MNLSCAGSFCRPPQEGDIIISKGSHSATGCFDVVIRHPETKDLVLFPLRFLDELDFDYSRSIHKISSTPVPDHVLPVGRLEHKWVAKML